MNTFTRSSIELISPSVNSGVSHPTFRNLFYEDSVRQSSTSYKLSKNNISYIVIISHFVNMSKKNRLPMYPRPYGRGLISAM